MRWVLLSLLLIPSAIGSVVRGDEPAKPDPKATAASLEGDWVLLPHKATLGAANKMVTWIDVSGFGYFKPLGVKELTDLSYLRFEKGKLRLLPDLDKQEARVTVRVEAPGEGVREAGFCRVVFEVDGKPLAGICRIQGEKLGRRRAQGGGCANTGGLAVCHAARKQRPLSEG